MKTVNAYEVVIPPFGMFSRRKIKIDCGNCRIIFEDDPVPTTNMVSKCPYCKTINKVPITKA